MQVAIEVTAEDIARGEPGICSTCPVALALNRQLPLLAFWFVGRVWLHSHGIGEHFKTPLEVGAFIEKFDSGKPISPFTFTIEIEE